jgi:hypothetical protein
MMAASYTAKDITVLEGLEPVRKRPGMYIGSRDSKGLMHCLWEIIDNAVDEALGGHGDEIDVVLHPDGSAEVHDHGRGIPVDIEPKTGMLTTPGMNTLYQGWRMYAAGYVLVPCTATGQNVIALTPILHREGAAVYANYETWVAVAAQTSTGSVTAFVTDGQTPLATLKVYKTNGAAQAGAGDVVAAGLYLFIYNSALDGGAGGFVLK